jgi:uncharacterized protein
MAVVSNTSTILNLAIIGQLELLKEQYGQIRIAKAVLDELRVGDDLPGCRAVKDAIKSGWLKVERVRDRQLVQVLKRDLDGGEAEAITLALELKVGLILLDERDARKEAKAAALEVTGVLGVLLRARRTGRLSSLRQAMQDLAHVAGFWINAQLLDEIQALPEYHDEWKPSRKLRENAERYRARTNAAGVRQPRSRSVATTPMDSPSFTDKSRRKQLLGINENGNW